MKVVLLLGLNSRTLSVRFEVPRTIVMYEYLFTTSGRCTGACGTFRSLGISRTCERVSAYYSRMKVQTTGRAEKTLACIPLPRVTTFFALGQTVFCCCHITTVHLFGGLLESWRSLMMLWLTPGPGSAPAACLNTQVSLLHA